VPTSALREGSEGALAQAVEKVADVTMTDGMIMDRQATYTWPTWSASRSPAPPAPATSTSKSSSQLVLADQRLRWPDGFSRAPDGSLYATASALHTFLPKLIVTDAVIAAGAP